MELDSVRGLKATLRQSVISPLAALKSSELPAGPTVGLPAAPPTIALGVSHTRLEGRISSCWPCASRSAGLRIAHNSNPSRSRRRGKSTSSTSAFRPSGPRSLGRKERARPLKIGISIGHYKITAGTLGGFVRSRDDGSVLILSNNHVLANENKGKKGDAVLQPGADDGGRNPEDKVGELLRFVRLKRERTDLVDCAAGRDRLEHHRRPDAHRPGQARRPG